MYASKLVFSQVIDHLPIHTFRRCVVRYQGNRYVKSFSCLDQYLCMAFAQLTYRESLRAIEACLRAQKDKLYHMGIRGGVSKSTLADANEARDWRIYADFAQSLICILPVHSMPTRSLGSTLTTPSTPSTPPRSISVFRSSLGRSSVLPSLPSSSIPCWIYGAISRLLSRSPTASCTMSTSSTSCCQSPEPSISWIVAMSISNGFSRSTWQGHSS